jgi:uncharacterized protein (DUF1501 family)
MISRRRFLRESSLVALAPLVPAFLDQAARAAGAKADSKILVVVQLDGGNDGINTVVPLADEAYAKLRPTLAIKPADALKLTDVAGLHPAMRAMAKMIEDGCLSIVQGVGYPNPNRSHFESMRIWQTARSAPEPSQVGWIGSALDQSPRPARAPGPDAIYVGEADVPRAIVGRRTDTAAVSSPDDLALRLPSVSREGPPAGDGRDDIAAFVRRSVLSAQTTARELGRPGTATAEATYPQTKLATQLKLVSRLIKSGASSRVYYASQSGYDTHYAQLQQHEDLLRELSGAMKAFADDLKSAGLWHRVLLMAFSEFGRRAAENGSIGTDHGAAAPVFLAGSGLLTPGLVGATPSLSDLDHGDVKSSADFRRIYAAILTGWLEVPAGQAMGGEFAPLPILRG